jgi:E3 ubiquitin-protein ligase UBR1
MNNIDIFLVQTLHRFGVIDYFNLVGLKWGGLDIESPEKFGQVVDDYLNLLIVLLSERSLSLGQDLVTTGKREIIHQLALYPDGIGFSELHKLMPERLVKMRDGSQTFEDLLLSVATLRLPTSLV